MAHQKRVTGGKKTYQKHAAAKQAVKKKQKGATKFHNEQLRTMLDGQASTLYSLNKVSKVVGTNSRPENMPVDSVQDLTSTLQNLSGNRIHPVPPTIPDALNVLGIEVLWADVTKEFGCPHCLDLIAT
ncbi:hypothetical protein LshimejAT787_1901340 [Lyophyllum shimeji]|uniref:Uncharacterized protein n=1 Tax=Lyophyllum shimeji TaxID=47721 RepID=A0A9P3UWF9_LYOSH|nr:hypothetical protein LshimejAT787_1901340 [Lyophyllum shimeji]